MKFLLVAINSKFIHSNPAVYSLKSYAERYIGKSEENAIEIEIAEYTINQQLEDILSDIYRRMPDFLGISCYIWNFDMVRNMLSEIPKILPNTGVFLGGPEVSYHPERVMEEFPYLKGIMIGEGEATFAELVCACSDVAEQGSDELNVKIKSIPGLYLSGGYTAMRKPLTMDEVPFFYKDADAFEDRILYYESSRGCPYNCSYCLSSIDRTLRLRTFEEVKEHLDYFLTKKVKQVKFIDRTFNANHEHAMAVWKYILKNDNGVTNFHFEIAADILRDDEIELISKMRPGLVQLEIGVQSTNEKTLHEINRYVDTDHIREVTARLLKPHNAHIHLDLIAGLPYEDYQSFIKSFNDVFGMRPHQLQLGFLKVLKGTVMEEHIEDYGLKYLSTPPYEVLSSKWISYDEIRNLKDVEKVLEDYYNTAQFTQTLPELMKLFDTPFDFFDSLAQFYRNNNYFVKTPARSRKYEILLEFTKNVIESENAPKLRNIAQLTDENRLPDGNRLSGENRLSDENMWSDGNGLRDENVFEDYIELIRNKLTLDYYLRENPKSRPDFVKEVPDLRAFDYSRRDPITNNVNLYVCDIRC